MPVHRFLGSSVAVSWLAAVSCVSLLLLAGCQRASSAGPAPAGAATEADNKEADAKEKASAGTEEEGVKLKPDEIEKAGITTTPAVGTEQAPETTGYALVVTRDAIAQVVADLSTSAAMERQSQAALARIRSLAGTPGAQPVEAQETAERQAAVDHAARMLAERRLSATYGRSAPWKDDYASPDLAALASGEIKLVRVTFPLGTLGSAVPAKLRLAHLGESPGAKSFESTVVWGAPADASLPGRSFFAELKGTDVSEGERLLARVAVGATEPGVIVPYAAVVLTGGKYWCYIEEHPGVFVRTEVDPGMPTDAGYFVKGVAAGAKIVTTSAGELLAREFGSAAAAD